MHSVVSAPDTTSYDLLSRHREDWTPETALIITPYVEPSFFKHIAVKLNPKRLHIVVDDGCRTEDLAKIDKALKDGGYTKTIYRKSGSAKGLVHIKLFYIRWRMAGGGASHSLVFGSANATRQGFGDHNAELVVGCKLTSTHHREIIAWCDAVIQATEARFEKRIEAAHGTPIAKGVELRLPAIVVGRSVNAASNFDLWVQRGRLLSDYRQDPAFLRVAVPLGRALLPSEQANLATGAGFDVQPTRSIAHRYIDDGSVQGDEPAENDLGHWRRKLFTQTDLGGEWCSEACYEAHHKGFRRRNHKARAAAVEKLKALKDSDTFMAARDAFLLKVESLWTALGPEASAILNGDKTLDRDYYHTRFAERVARDLKWIEDPEFRNRYITGFSTVEVPRFRDDRTGWTSFVKSLGRELALGERRGRSQSRLLMAVRRAVQEAGKDEDLINDPKALIDFLRAAFREDESADAIREYHLDPA